jgi:hypothetical protein
LDTVSGLPLTSLLEEIDALEALEDVALHLEGAGGLEAVVLRHRGRKGSDGNVETKRA